MYTPQKYMCVHLDSGTCVLPGLRHSIKREGAVTPSRHMHDPHHYCTVHWQKRVAVAAKAAASNLKACKFTRLNVIRDSVALVVPLQQFSVKWRGVAAKNNMRLTLSSAWGVLSVGGDLHESHFCFCDSKWVASTETVTDTCRLHC